MILDLNMYQKYVFLWTESQTVPWHRFAFRSFLKQIFSKADLFLEAVSCSSSWIPLIKVLIKYEVSCKPEHCFLWCNKTGSLRTVMHLSHLSLHLTKLPLNNCALFIGSAAVLWMLFMVLRLYYMSAIHTLFAGKTCESILFLCGRFEPSKCFLMNSLFTHEK